MQEVTLRYWLLQALTLVSCDKFIKTCLLVFVCVYVWGRKEHWGSMGNECGLFLLKYQKNLLEIYMRHLHHRFNFWPIFSIKTVHHFSLTLPSSQPIQLFRCPLIYDTTLLVSGHLSWPNRNILILTKRPILKLSCSLQSEKLESFW